MRNIIMTVICMLVVGITGAQEKNHISMDPFLPIFGTFQFQYERGINEKMSIGLSTGLKLSSGVFNISGIDINRISTDEFNFKGIKILPEFRWYLQRSSNGLSGFYAGAYTKYQNFNDAITGVYTDNDQIDNDIEIDTKIRTLSAGLEIGYKLMIKRGFFIDFLIAGPGISTNKLRLEERKPIPDEFYEDLSDALSQYGFFEWLDADFRINGNQDTNIVLPAFRYGIKLGYSF